MNGGRQETREVFFKYTAKFIHHAESSGRDSSSFKKVSSDPRKIFVCFLCISVLDVVDVDVVFLLVFVFGRLLGRRLGRRRLLVAVLLAVGDRVGHGHQALATDTVVEVDTTVAVIRFRLLFGLEMKKKV